MTKERPGKSVRTASQASAPPMAVASTAVGTAISSELSNGPTSM